MTGENAYPGFAAPTVGTNEFNELNFIIRSILAGVSTALPVLVKAVTNAGTVEAPGFVDVQPMVAQIDSRGQVMPHGTIYNIPYVRLQGGGNAVIIDPVVGDIGLCVFASRDISAVKANKAPSQPGSRRQFSMADGVYIGGLLNTVPTSYIRFKANGDIVMKPTATVAVIGTLTATVDVIAAGKSLKLHTHGGVTTGGGTSGPPS